MKVTHIEAGHYCIPLPTVLSDATHGLIPDFALITVRLTNDEGVEGLGYTYTVGQAGGAAIYAMIVRDLSSVIVGADPRCTEALWEQMWWRTHWVGRGGVAVFAISAVDIALWDLRAKCAGEPLWRLLGGAAQRVKAYVGGIDLQFPVEDLVRQAKDALARGFRAIKVKVGRDALCEDVARVAAVREAVGPDVRLMVDANMRWSVPDAIRAARALAPYDIYWLEEPIIPDDVEGFARVAREGGLPIATGENLHTLSEFQQMIARGEISFVQPDVSNMGGVTPWMKVAHLAQACNLAVTSHGVHDLHVHLLAAVPNASYLEIHGFGLERFMHEPLRFDRGDALVPERIGHGVTLDWEALETHRVRLT